MRHSSPTAFGVLLLSLGCCSCSTAATLVPQTTIAPYVFLSGGDGAECMAAVLRAAAPDSDPRTGTFQDFDVVFPIVEYTYRNLQLRLKVVAASERGGYTLAGRGDSEARYFYREGTSAIPASIAGWLPTGVMDGWAARCGAVERVPPPPLVNLRESDFALMGMLDVRQLLEALPMLTLTPVDIE